MAQLPIDPASPPQLIDKAIEAGGIVESKPEKEGPSYKMLGDSKVAVSKHAGTVWKARRDAALTARVQSRVGDAWEEAFKYYANDQLSHRQSTVDGAGNRAAASQDNNARTHAETENVVYANVNALGPSLFSKNPEPEITSEDPEEATFNSVRLPAERLLKVLGAKKTAPGINLKSRIRRAIVLATLTNNAWATVDYTRRSESSERSQQDLIDASARLEKAKTPKEVEQIEQELVALEKRFSFLRPSGFIVRIWNPKQFLTAPGSEEEDLSDAPWVMYYDFMSTAYIQAVFMTKKGDKHTSIYQPTHIAKLNVDNSDTALDEQVANFKLFSGEEGDDDFKKYGYSSKVAFDSAKYTKVWYVWDAVTRRVLLYNDKDWTYPIWVWDDPYKLQEFFNATKLSFVTDPQGGDSRGEVTYYLDQQDAINTINSEEARAREWAKRNVFFDTNSGLKQDEVEAILRGPDGTARGIAFPEGKKLDDIVGSIKPPMSNHKELFNKEPKFAAIDRISQMNAVLRGEEFKTNTTNDAIAQYQQSTNTRLDDRVDRVEDFIAAIYWKVLQIALQEMSAEDVAIYIGKAASAAWRTMSYDEIQLLSLRIEGGSTQKPTSKAKKAEAVQVGQVLGQFVKVSPVALLIAIKMLEKSFDEIVIKEEDWTLLRQSVEQAIQGQGSPDKLAQAIDGLPPEAKQALGAILAKGIPVEKAVETIINELKSTQPPADNAQPPQTQE